ncbi:flagellar basal-body MS-ring/collar protein FliF [Enterobacteriaceae bacterium ESL0689]|nr:flagellar basal-body MS-ring/collar protein FliF [Enterobacteriaceae bacterium ESL0689]
MNATITAGEKNDNGLQTILHRLRTNPKVSLLISAAAAIAIVVALLLWAKNSTYRVLYNNLNDRDGGAIVTQLTQMNIPYRFAENGSALLVPEEKVHEVRLRLAQQGLPKGGAVGFELLDEEKFGISQFSEQINYQRALEGELARTIESLGPVQRARVHLALPKPSLFIREQKSPSASVTLTLQNGRALDDEQISAIVYMVSSSVANLPADKITIVDQAGRLLTHSSAQGRDINASQLKYTHEVESGYQRRIEAILSPIVGAANVRAQVTAQIDFSHREQTEEQYQPNQQLDKAAIRSRQTSDSEQRGGTQAGGVPGALTNQPTPPATAPIETAKADEDNKGDTQNTPAGNPPASSPATAKTTTTSNNGILNSRHDATTNYELDRTIRHIQQKSNSVARLSVAVVVNYQGVDKDGKPKPISKEQLEKIEALTREAMGYSSARGDTLQVVNTLFTDLDSAQGELPFWKTPMFIDKVFDIGRYLIVMLIAWLLWRKWIKPQLQQHQTVMKMAATAAAAASSGNDAVMPEHHEQEQRRRAQQRANTEVQSQRVRELSDKDPRIVALVIRQWMSNEL